MIWNGEKCDRNSFSVIQNGVGGGGGASQWPARPACKPFGDIHSICPWANTQILVLTTICTDLHKSHLFHCSQAAEKAIKAALIARNTDEDIPGAGHDLIDMCQLLADPSLSELVLTLHNMIGVPSRMRYPDMLPHPQVPHDVYTGPQASNAWEIAGQILQHVHQNYIVTWWTSSPELHRHMMNMFTRTTWWTRSPELHRHMMNMFTRTTLWTRSPELHRHMMNAFTRTTWWTRSPELHRHMMNMFTKTTWWTCSPELHNEHVHQNYIMNMFTKTT